MPLTDEQLGALLVEQSYLSEPEVKDALADSTKRHVSLSSVLVEKGLLTHDLLENALAEHYKLEFIDLHAAPPDPATVALLPEAIARRYNVILARKDEKGVTIATSDPGQEHLEEIVRENIGSADAIIPEDGDKKDPSTMLKAGKRGLFGFGGAQQTKSEVFTGAVSFAYAPRESIEAMFQRYRKPLETRFQALIDSENEVAPEILVEIINDAIQLRASDIHFEPQEGIVIVRFRVDGVMHEAGRIPKPYYEGVVNRIKIESNMRIDEHFKPQDGAIRHKTSRGMMDIRVSIVPVVDGEKAVMRLLSEYVRSLTLADLGFSAENQAVLEDASRKPFGMILTTGPTGSGKSTTLYALIKQRNTPDVNISTIEDPVEYKIPGINHIQANPEAGLTFATGLRALVRQDPNIILVGEIRDGETADIAVNAALTGHLLFSTLHANDAATAVPRLLDMGVEPFLLASTLEVIIGQRLIRRICPQCRFSYTIPLEKAQALFKGAERHFTTKGEVTLYKGKGCEACGGTGFRGRMGIHELLMITPEIEELIIKRASSTDISMAARKQGMKLMFEDGFVKMLAGVTTIEELLRMAAPPDIVLGSHDNNAK